MSPVDLSTKRVPLKEAASILGVSVATLRSWERKRRISSYRICKKVTFTTAELERIIREGERPRLVDVSQDAEKLVA